MSNIYRSLVSEWLGTLFLLATVIGSGIMAENLAAGNMAIALLGNTMETTDADLLPAPNMLQSGIDRLAQKISGIPQVRVDVPNENDSTRSKMMADKLERIVTNYDDKQNLNLQLAQAARWLPGYGFCAWVMSTKVDIAIPCC